MVSSSILQHAYDMVDTVASVRSRLAPMEVYSAVVVDDVHAYGMADTIASLRNRLAFMKAYSAVMVDDDYHDDPCTALTILTSTLQFSQCGSVHNVNDIHKTEQQLCSALKNLAASHYSAMETQQPGYCQTLTPWLYKPPAQVVNRMIEHRRTE
eukprot:9024-Heterococcus_DN1.PRE.3